MPRWNWGVRWCRAGWWWNEGRVGAPLAGALAWLGKPLLQCLRASTIDMAPHPGHPQGAPLQTPTTCYWPHTRAPARGAPTDGVRMITIPCTWFGMTWKAPKSKCGHCSGNFFHAPKTISPNGFKTISPCSTLPKRHRWLLETIVMK